MVASTAGTCGKDTSGELFEQKIKIKNGKKGEYEKVGEGRKKKCGGIKETGQYTHPRGGKTVA